jgi:hypothetical protein
MFRHPDAAVALAFLGKDSDTSLNAIAEIENHFSGVERAHVDIVKDLSAETPNDPARADPIRVLGGKYGGGDIAVDIEPLKIADSPFDGIGVQDSPK